MHLFIYFGCVGSSLMGRLFSSCKEKGLLSAAAHGLLIAMASCCRERLWAWQLQQLQLPGSRAQAQKLWHTGLVAPQHVESSQSRDETHVYNKRWNCLPLSHQGSPECCFYIKTNRGVHSGLTDSPAEFLSSVSPHSISWDGLVLQPVRFSSVTQLCPTLWDTLNCSKPDFPVHRQHPEIAQTHVHSFGDAIQPSHPLSSPSPPAFNLSQHQGLFQWVSSSHQVAKGLEFQLQHRSFQWIYKIHFC